MQYVCLVYLVEKDMNAMTKKESDTCIDESLAYDDALRKAGHLIIAHALQPVEAATTIRVRSGKLSATDGPFDLADYPLAHSARADLCRRLGKTGDARASYERALGLTRQEPQRRFLERRLSELRA
jgi:hypothetical protein